MGREVWNMKGVSFQVWVGGVREGSGGIWCPVVLFWAGIYTILRRVQSKLVDGWWRYNHAMLGLEKVKFVWWTKKRVVVVKGGLTINNGYFYYYNAYKSEIYWWLNVCQLRQSSGIVIIDIIMLTKVKLICGWMVVNWGKGVACSFLSQKQRHLAIWYFSTTVMPTGWRYGNGE